jgi:hypothetical protein
VHGAPFDESTGLGWLYRVAPVKDIHQLHVTWQVPEQLSKYRYVFQIELNRWTSLNSSGEEGE